jgi:hypothetical protein
LQVVHSVYNREPPARWIAWLAAYRSVVEVGTPNAGYDGLELPEASELEVANIPTHATLKLELNEGISSTTTINGKTYLVRAITSRCLNGSNPDYGTLDVGEVTVPQRVRKELQSEFDWQRVQNPYVGADPAEGAAPIEGVLTPTIAKGLVVGLEKDWERDGWLADVDTYPPSVEYDTTSKRIMIAAPVSVRKRNVQVGVSVRQLAV